MYEGKPLVIVVGGADTGRTPIAAALLRRALGPDVIVQTAGVVAHVGEGATQEAQMALESLGLNLSNHRAQALEAEQQRTAELLLAIDRGTELVLHTRLPNDPRVAALPVLADLPDVLDPHRMPLGVWVAATRRLEEQIAAALPQIRQRLGLAVAEPPKPLSSYETPPSLPMPALGGMPAHDWTNDAAMERLMGLLDHEAEAVQPAEPQSETVQEQPRTEEAPAPALDEPASSAEANRMKRADYLARLLDIAAEAPEIIDWQRLQHALVSGLRAIAQQPESATDFVPAAVLMLEGKLAQQAALPAPDALTLLRRSILRLRTTVGPNELAGIGSDVASW